MQVRAVSMGSQVPPAPFAGAVHSIFRRACNVELGDGRLLIVLEASRGSVPHGIAVAAAAGFDLRRWVKPGETVSASGHVIRFASAPLLVDIQHAAVAGTSVGHIVLDMESGPTRAAWRAAWSRIAAAAPPDGLGALLSRSRCSPLTALLLDRARRHISALMRATQSFDHAAAISAATATIGTGPGLTPSWDDFLVGFLSGLRTTARGRRQRSFVAALGQGVRAAAPATTLVSRAQLEHAARGHVSELLVAMLEAIAAGRVGHTREATARVLDAGSTSGSDTALGTLFGAAAWQPDASHAPSIEAALSPVR